jgi:hypothetical protein
MHRCLKIQFFDALHPELQKNRGFESYNLTNIRKYLRPFYVILYENYTYLAILISPINSLWG